MTLDNGTHISWWPRGVHYDQFPFLPDVYTADPLDMPNLNADIRGEEGRAPDVEIVISSSCIDENAIGNWWHSFKKSHKWKTLTQNCSTTVSDGIKIGFGNLIKIIRPRQVQIWTPADVEDFAIDIYNYINL